MPDASATWSRAPAFDERLTDTRFLDVRWFSRIDSTNRYLLGEAASGDRTGEAVVAVADEQTAGRGRHGRTWSAEPGAALLVSVLLRPRLAPDRMHLVTLAAAVAATEAVRATGGFDALVKWPNDLVVGDRKLAGVLAEADGGGAVVVGMGLNLRADAYPADLRDLATACDLHATGPVDRVALLAAWLRAFDHWLDAPDDVVGTAAAHSATLGRRVRVELAHETFGGVAASLTPEGFLVVRTDDDTDRVVTAGDVIHLRPND
jgi:BirA family biotin operon repressor/biotin-[acetyl-CoA-carboxylase] ligase